ncbi:hypothetical protein ACQPZF_24420 [Actinosynnema sp. CS-041913]|uniref:hypothetical protein n=1 Tax=Actinosynnema sp. CS-041913 TaxID=3239917 RepID=UPI003D900063
MSVWSRHGVLEKVRDALAAVTIVNPNGHHLGRPFMTAYQLAIKLDEAHPEVARALGVEIGGSGIGSHNSLAQYLAHELSRGIKEAGGSYPIEGAFLSNDHVTALNYVTSDGREISSSATGSGLDVTLFRLRSADRV